MLYQIMNPSKPTSIDNAAKRTPSKSGVRFCLFQNTTNKLSAKLAERLSLCLAVIDRLAFCSFRSIDFNLQIF